MIDGWAGGRMDGCTDRWTDGWINWMHASIDGWVSDEWMDG